VVEPLAPCSKVLAALCSTLCHSLLHLGSCVTAPRSRYPAMTAVAVATLARRLIVQMPGVFTFTPLGLAVPPLRERARALPYAHDLVPPQTLAAENPDGCVEALRLAGLLPSSQRTGRGPHAAASRRS